MSEQTTVWDLALIQKYNYSGPRYTSYPTALEFSESYNDAAFEKAAARYPDRSLSLYVHIPFCHKLSTSAAAINWSPASSIKPKNI